MTSLEQITRVLGELQVEVPTISHHFLEESQRWWEDKSVLFSPESERVGLDAEAQVEARKRHPIVASFTVEEFRGWYAKFFLDRIKHSGMLADTGILAAIHTTEEKLRRVSPDDPSIYPLVEQPLSQITRTTAFDGGMLSFIDALLPTGQSVRVVAKKVPDQLAPLYEREVTIHKALARLGHSERVTLPIHVEPRNRTITYGHFAGDLSCLQTAPENVKRKYLQEALDLLMGVSLDLAVKLQQGARRNAFEPLREELMYRNYTTDYLVERFCDNFILRLAAAQDAVNPFNTTLSDFYDVLRGRKSLTDVPQAREYRNLAAIVENPKARTLVQEYERTIASNLDALPRYPGHDDFTVANILVQEIEQPDAERLYLRGLRLHDIGLVNAPFQSYVFDLVVSAHAQPSTRQEILTATYLKLEGGCKEKRIPFSSSLEEFGRGYQVVAVDKYLKQAALQFMYQQLDLTGGNHGA